MAIKKTQSHLESMGLRVVAMDTDSCFILLPTDIPVDVTEVFLTWLADQISSDLFDHKLTLEYEKQLRPLLLVAKKKYMGHNPKPDPGEDSMLMKGLASKRRDTMPFVRKTLKGVLEMIRTNSSAESALQYVRSRFGLLLSIGGEPLCTVGLKLEDFVITSKIKHRLDYNTNKNAQYTFPIGFRANQMLEHPLGPGERISFLYYYDKNNEKHNGSKRPDTNWTAPNNNNDIVVPLGLMEERAYRIDVMKVLEQHYNELRQYFSAISTMHRTGFDRLFKETISVIKRQRGCKNGKNYIIRECGLDSV
jgi:DNA polymerase elongation subunit (family B)